MFGYAGYAGSFGGGLDDICLYNRVLSASEVTALNTRTGTGTLCHYALGLQLISQSRRATTSSSWGTSYYGYDGLGSVRALYDGTGAATDTYNYDAFGNLQTAGTTGGTVNNFRFAGQQWDPDLKLYYNRARYLNTS